MHNVAQDGDTDGVTKVEKTPEKCAFEFAELFEWYGKLKSPELRIKPYLKVEEGKCVDWTGFVAFIYEHSDSISLTVQADRDSHYPQAQLEVPATMRHDFVNSKGKRVRFSGVLSDVGEGVCHIQCVECKLIEDEEPEQADRKLRRRVYEVAEHFTAVQIYRDDLEEIVEILGDDGREVNFVGALEYSSIEELRQREGDTIHNLEVSCGDYGDLVSVRISAEYGASCRAKAGYEAEMYKLFCILKRTRRPFGFLPWRRSRIVLEREHKRSAESRKALSKFLLQTAIIIITVLVTWIMRDLIGNPSRHDENSSPSNSSSVEGDTGGKPKDKAKTD